MLKRSRMKRGNGKGIGYWKIKKTLNPPLSVIARVKWKKLPKEAFYSSKKKRGKK